MIEYRFHWIDRQERRGDLWRWAFGPACSFA